MSKKNTGRRGRQANIVGASGTATVGFDGLMGTTTGSGLSTNKTTTVTPVITETTPTKTISPTVDPVITPATPTTPVKTVVSPTVDPVITPATPTTPVKTVVSPTVDPVITPATPTTPVKVGITDGPEPDLKPDLGLPIMPLNPIKPVTAPDENTGQKKEEDMENTKPGFGGLGESEDLKNPSIGVPKMPDVAIGVGQPDAPAEEKTRSGKNKKWLVVIVAGIALLWLLFKKK